MQTHTHTNRRQDRGKQKQNTKQRKPEPTIMNIPHGRHEEKVEGHWSRTSPGDGHRLTDDGTN